MTPGLTTSEIVRVLHAAGKRLTAKEIFAAGSFDYEHTSNNALSHMARDDDSPVAREKSADGLGIFSYFIKPGADLKPWLEGGGKNGVQMIEIPEFAPRPAKNVAAAQASPSVAAADSPKGAVAPAPAATPVKITAGELPQSPQKNAGASGGVVSATPIPKQDQLASPPAPGKLSPEKLLCTFDQTGTNFEPDDILIDGLFTSLVLRLPREKTRWTKAQRESWLRMFNAAADFLYPESK